MDETTKSIPDPQSVSQNVTRWRPEQQRALEHIVNSTNDVLALSLPTGSGKTYVGLGVAQLFDRTAILTETRELQHQYIKGLRSAERSVVVLMGRSAYPCVATSDSLTHPKNSSAVFEANSDGTIAPNCDEAPCQVGWSCSRKDGGCHYYDALRSAQRASVVVANYDAWIARRRRTLDSLGEFDALVLDEADEAPEKLAKQLTVTLPLKQQVLHPPESETLRKWQEWARAALEIFASCEDDDVPVTANEVKDERDRQRLITKFGSISQMDDDAWIVTRSDKDHSVRFEAVSPREHTLPLFGRIKSRTVLMSATLTPTTTRLLGLSDADVDWFFGQSDFPPSRAPITLVETRIHSRNYAALQQDATWRAITQEIDTVIAGRPGRRGLVHAISYDYGRKIYQHSTQRHRLIVPDGPKARGEALRRFQSTPGAVLVAPSVEKGINFPYDQCEYQIIWKAPADNPTNLVLKARESSMPGYLHGRLAHRIVQMSGRGMRSADDWCETIIFDRYLEKLFRGRGFEAHFPTWFIERFRHQRTIPVALILEQLEALCS